MRVRTLVLAIGLLVPGAAAWADPVADCDRLAGNPTDADRVGPGILWEKIDDAPAIAACTAAVALEPGVPRLRYQLGRALDHANRVDEALTAYRKAAAAGYAPALNAVGYFYDEGIGVGQDFAAALEYYRRAADLGFPDAIANIGYAYQYGRGVPVDLAEAARRYEEAGAGGVSWAARTVGYMYEQGDGVAQDDAAAVRWYRVAAKAGDALGANNLGNMYLEGRGGLPQDMAEAARLFGIARDGGEPLGAFNLGRMSQYGLGMPVDLAEAEGLYREAVAGGWNPAKNALAWLLAIQGIKLGEAETLAREVVDATPAPAADRANYVDTLAWVLFKQGRLAEAATASEEAVRLDAARPTFLDHLGDIYAAQGRTDAARAAWRKALALPPSGDPDWDPAPVRAKLGG
jgi:TPR repeat protein